MESFYNAIASWFQGIWDLIVAYFTWLSDAYDSIINFFKELPAWLFGKFAEGIVEFYNSIPVPDFFATAQQAFSSIPPEVVFFAESFQIGPGITMVLGAYLLRFILRRIPFIG